MRTAELYQLVRVSILSHAIQRSYYLPKRMAFHFQYEKGSVELCLPTPSASQMELVFLLFSTLIAVLRIICLPK